jgi:hypothetical protein
LSLGVGLSDPVRPWEPWGSLTLPMPDPAPLGPLLAALLAPDPSKRHRIGAISARQLLGGGENVQKPLVWIAFGTLQKMGGVAAGRPWAPASVGE